MWLVGYTYYNALSSSDLGNRLIELNRKFIAEGMHWHKIIIIIVNEIQCVGRTLFCSPKKDAELLAWVELEESCGAVSISADMFVLLIVSEGPSLLVGIGVHWLDRLLTGSGDSSCTCQ